jgi:PAS domain S-box-containing protein
MYLSKEVSQSSALDTESDASVFDTEQILNALLQEASDCIAIKDCKGQYQWINEMGASFLGYAIDDVIGKTDYDLFSLETANRIVKTDQEVMQSGKTKTYEAFLKPLNGKDCYFQAMKCPVKNNDKEVIGIINVVRKITNKDLLPIV